MKNNHEFEQLLVAHANKELTREERCRLEDLVNEEPGRRDTMVGFGELHQLLDEELRDLEPGAMLSGETAFKLHDTFGFPRELTEEIVSERGFQVDLAEFNSMMESQRERARAAFKGVDAAARADVYRTLLSGVDHTDFVGYDREEGVGRILSIVSDGE